MVPGLHIVDATPEEDEASLTALAHWCIGYSPIVAANPPDGIWIDVAGAAHLFGGEEKLVTDLVRRLRSQNIQADACVADAPGTAWGIVRYGSQVIVPPGRSIEAVEGLPLPALRLPQATVEALHRLGIERIGQLAAMPRAPIVRRFGKEVVLRLDQAFGHVVEPLNPLMPKDVPARRVTFAEPIGRLEDLQSVVRRLADRLCRDLERASLGIRRLDLVFERIDRCSIAFRIGTAKATREARHLAKLFDERLQTADPGFGIEAAALMASKVEPLSERQIAAKELAKDEADNVDLSHLVDRLSTRLGPKRVYRLAPVESRVPERTMKRIPALAPMPDANWPEDLPRPARLLDPPEPVTATALLPDHPPAFFVWRNVRHRVVRADGPERITGEWWKSEREHFSLRDYYRVESEQGTRFWLFRDAPTAEGGRWWMHGFFA